MNQIPFCQWTAASQDVRRARAAIESAILRHLRPHANALPIEGDGLSLTTISAHALLS